MLVLGIETSCDETSIAIVEDGKRIISLEVYSQIEIHRRFDGVVPEIASRNHLIKILEVLEKVTRNFSLSEIELFSATNGPGLIGSLLVGTNVAKSLSLNFSKPYIPVNHILSHLYAPHLENEIPFPYIGLVASGGHTILFLVKSFNDIEFLGSTIDDAVGEAYDKVAKLLNLGYPGGPAIDRLAKQGDPDAITELRNIALPLEKERDRYNFSYSGLKTAIAYRIRNIKLSPEIIPHIACSFQKIAIDHLLDKSMNAIKDFKIKRLVISGGVSANSYLRKRAEELKEEGIEVFFPPLKLCSDNAAMVAGRAYIDYSNNPIPYSKETLRATVFSRLPEVKKGKRNEMPHL